jgi:hypothetical protein
MVLYNLSQHDTQMNYTVVLGKKRQNFPNQSQILRTAQQSAKYRRPAGLVVCDPDYKTRGPGFKSRKWVGVFVMNNYTCSRVMAVCIYYYQYILYMYDLCMFIRYLVSITQVLTDT